MVGYIILELHGGAYGWIRKPNCYLSYTGQHLNSINPCSKFEFLRKKLHRWQFIKV